MVLLQPSVYAAPAGSPQCEALTVTERYALECVAERSATADPGGDLVQRLRLKNRRLEKELVSLTAKREEYYAKKMRETEEKCQRIMKEKDDAQSAWYGDQKKELSEIRTASVLMYKMMETKRDRLGRQYTKDVENWEAKVKKAQDETVRIKTEAQAKVESLERRYTETCADYEAQVAHLQEKTAQLEDKKAKLESQVSAFRVETQELKQEKEEQAAEIVQLRRSLNEAERMVEALKSDTRIKAMEERALQEKNRLEDEVMEYVKYIVCTPEARSVSPDFPWELLPKPELIENAAKHRKAASPLSRRPLASWPEGGPQRSVTASPWSLPTHRPSLPAVSEPVKRAGTAMACYGRGR